MRRLDDGALATYLNDHLAGSVAALQLMGRICDQHTDCRLGRLMAGLRVDVEAEQDLLRQMLQELDKPENSIAKSVAWVGEQLSRLKIGAGQDDASGLRLFEALEALRLAFTGRLALWSMLGELEGLVPVPPDVRAMATRAQDHITQLETERLAAGRRALTLDAAPAVASS